MHVHAVLLALSIALLAPTPAVLFSQASGSLVLAVLRRDGVVVPFAAFNGQRWSRRWPDRPPLELPISLDDVPGAWWGADPAPRRMQHWNDGVRVGEVTLQGPVLTSLMCQPRLALRSNYTPTAPVPPRFVLPYPKDGLLVSGDAAVETIAVVEPATAEARTVLALIEGEFNKQENIAAGRFTAWRHPVKPDLRKRVPITVEAIYRAAADDPGWTSYFVETIRQFPPGEGDRDNCGLATFVSGWVMVGPEGRKRVQLAAAITYCDRKDVGYMLPFGLVRANAKTYWVFQRSGFEGEAYHVVRPGSRGVDTEVIYTAGICAH